jgi:hypothetical protein
LAESKVKKKNKVKRGKEKFRTRSQSSTTFTPAALRPGLTEGHS